MNIARSLSLASVASCATLAGCYGDIYLGTATTSGSGASGSTTSSAGTGGSGGAGACAPLAVESFYSGPAGTEGVGICKAGLRTCQADRTWGACAGEVLPQPENCNTPDDEDCDGTSPPCGGMVLWAKGFGDMSAQVGLGIVADNAGDVVFVGAFSGSIDFGGGPLYSAGTNDVYAVKLDAEGNHLWSKRFGGIASTDALAIAVDAERNVIIAGAFSGSIDFGGDSLVSSGGRDVFVAKLDPDGGNLWSKRFGDAADQKARSVAADSAGNVLVAGTLAGSADFGGGVQQSAGGSDGFVVKLAPNGDHQWTRRFGDAADDVVNGIAVDGMDNAIATGSFNGTVDFGGGSVSSVGGSDGFVVKLDPTGAHLWTKRFGDGADQAGSAVAADASGNIVVTGSLTGSADFGGQPLASAGGADVFVVKFDNSGGHVWSIGAGDGEDQRGSSVAIDDMGNVIVVGNFNGIVGFGGEPLHSAGGGDLFVVKLASDGKLVWGTRSGDTMIQVGACTAVDAQGNTFVVGHFSGSMDFNDAPLVSAGGTDIFIAKFAP